MAECEPYSASPLAYEKKLADEGLDGSCQYTSELSQQVAKCALSVLQQMLPLTSDSIGSSSQGYTKDGLLERMSAICRENGLDEAEVLPTPSVVVYHNIF